MCEQRIEAIIGSPPHRDELVVQLFAKEDGQWAELFREEGAYWIELYGKSGAARFNADDFIRTISQSLNELRTRLES